jgi:UDP-N-acetylmuramoyl-L-alanine---L-glutamate ligase
VIVLLGLGRETRELARLLRARDADVHLLLLDEGTPDADVLAGLADLALEVRVGIDLDVAGAIPPDAHAVYRSPGVSPYRPAVTAAIDAGVPVTTPTGWWAAQRTGDDVIAVTGTKGKSTTAAMIAHLLRAAGRDVALLGNIGRAALQADAPELDVDDVVLELSSYQLADLHAHVAIGAITTLLVDHVPWHGSVARYHADKLRLLELADAVVVTPGVADHPGVEAARSRIGAVASSTDRAAIGAALRAAGLVGEHLIDDAVLALAVVDQRLGRAGGVRELIAALAEFEPLPHRLTPVGEHGGVRFVDDSISTVPESAVAAVRAYLERGPVTVLLGGDDRGQHLEPLLALLGDERVRAVLLPPLGARLGPALRATDHPGIAQRVTDAADLAEAVAIAAERTPPGGSVLLSPAAPSFGSYRDFIARGEHFVALVDALG